MKLNRLLTNEEYKFLQKNKEVFYGKGGQWEGSTCATWKKEHNRLNEKELKILNKIEKILKEVILGFSIFNKFINLETEEIRIEYNWDEGIKNGIYFIGVGYVTLKELRYGFED